MMSVSVHFKPRSAGASLEINHDEWKHFVFERSEADGIRDLRHLAESSDTNTEEAWFFVRGRDAKGHVRELWYEVGERETEHGAKILNGTVESIVDDCKKRGIVLDGDEAAFKLYHFHGAYVKNTPQRECPSPKDVLQVDAYTRKAIAKGLPIAPVEAGIVTPEGLWSIKWSKSPPIGSSKESSYKKELDERIGRMADYQASMMEICGKVAMLKMSWDIPLCRSEHSIYAQMITTSYVQADFKPFEK